MKAVHLEKLFVSRAFAVLKWMQLALLNFSWKCAYSFVIMWIQWIVNLKIKLYCFGTLLDCEIISIIFHKSSWQNVERKNKVFFFIIIKKVEKLNSDNITYSAPSCCYMKKYISKAILKLCPLLCTALIYFCTVNLNDASGRSGGDTVKIFFFFLVSQYWIQNVGDELTFLCTYEFNTTRKNNRNSSGFSWCVEKKKLLVTKINHWQT